jgi:hypothetical protein
LKRNACGPLSFVALALGLIPGLLGAQADKAKETKAPAKEAQAPENDQAKKLEDLVKRLDAARKALEEKLKAAKSDDEREKIWKAESPAKVFVPEFQALAEAAKGTEVAARSLVQVYALAGDDAPEIAKAAARKLLDEYIGSPELAGLILGLENVLGETESAQALARLKEKNSTRPVQAMLLFAEAQKIESEKGEDAPELHALYEHLATEFKDVRLPRGEGTLGDLAAGWLFVRDNLVVGKAAPDFETVDEGGVKWKLSDYKGKVVVLDFWGEW